MEEFETIEHDMIHIKDYFRNFKFGMQERLSKLYFLQNLNITKINDSSDLLKKSKEKLVEIKNKGKEYDSIIKETSVKIHNIEQEIENKTKELNELNEKIKQHNSDLDAKQAQSLLLNSYIGAKNKYNRVYEEIQKTLSKITEIKKNLEFTKEFNIEDLEKQRTKLQTRTRRLSVIQYEKYVEDLFDFYSNFNIEVSKIFGVNIISKVLSDTIYIECEKLNKIVKIEVNKGKIINIEGIVDEYMVKYFVKLNNPRFVVYYAMNN